VRRVYRLIRAAFCDFTLYPAIFASLSLVDRHAHSFSYPATQHPASAYHSIYPAHCHNQRRGRHPLKVFIYLKSTPFPITFQIHLSLLSLSLFKTFKMSSPPTSSTREEEIAALSVVQKFLAGIKSKSPASMHACVMPDGHGMRYPLHSFIFSEVSPLILTKF
jgi:hypothetical protein